MITVEMGNARVLERMRARIATAAVRETSFSALLQRTGPWSVKNLPSMPDSPRVRLVAASQTLFRNP
jgi:hypothetical protein